MKINQVNSIELCKLFQGEGAKNKIKTLSDKDRKIVLAALQHIEKNKFSTKSDSSIKKLITKLTSEPVKAHKPSTKFEAFFKGVMNTLNLRVSSLMINESMQALKDKKIQIEHRSSELGTKIEHLRKDRLDNKECISILEKTIPFKLQVHRLLVKHANIVHQKDFVKAGDMLADEFSRVTKQFKNMDSKDDLYEEMKSYHKCLQGLVEHKDGVDSKAYIRDVSLMIEAYKSGLTFLPNAIKELKQVIKQENGEITQLKQQLKKVNSEKVFYTRLFPPVLYGHPAPNKLPSEAPLPKRSTVETISY